MSTESLIKSPIAENLSQMQIALHLPCARCGYELRELMADGDCPECGEPIRLTIIEVIDPASKRLTPIHKPKAVGDSIACVVLFFFVAVVLYVTAIVSKAPESLPVPDFLRNSSTMVLICVSVAFGLLAILAIVPMMKMSKRLELASCRTGIILTFVGLLLWSISMALIAFVLLNQQTHSKAIMMLFDTCLPAIAGGIVFSGFRRIVPRLGQRSRAFRQAQGSRQRMNDLLAALVVLIVGRTLMAVSPTDSNIALLALIVMIMSLSLVVIGLGYLLHNIIWIRNALITPPPAIPDLLRSKS